MPAAACRYWYPTPRQRRLRPRPARLPLRRHRPLRPSLSTKAARRQWARLWAALWAAWQVTAVQGCEALCWLGCKLGVGVSLGVLLCVCRSCLMHLAAPTCLLTQRLAACPISHSPPAAIAAAAAGLLWLRRRRRRAALGALPHGTSKGALHSGSGGGKGGGRGDAAVEELHIMQQKGLAASHHASGSSIPAGWRCALGCVGVSTLLTD